MSNPYVDFYVEQAGNGLSHFSGTRYQRGRGIGSVLSNLFRSVLFPAMKSGAKYLGKAALNTGVNIAGDMLTGDTFKDAFKTRGKETAAEIVDRVKSKMMKQQGEGIPPLSLLTHYGPELFKKYVNYKINDTLKQKGSGYIRRRKRKQYKGVTSRKVTKRKRKRKISSHKSPLLTELEKRLR